MYNIVYYYDLIQYYYYNIMFNSKIKPVLKDLMKDQIRGDYKFKTNN